MLPLFQQGIYRLIDDRAVLRATPGLCDVGNDPGALPAPAAGAKAPRALQLIELLVQPDKLLRLLLLLLFQPDQAPQLRRKLGEVRGAVAPSLADAGQHLAGDPALEPLRTCQLAAEDQAVKAALVDDDQFLSATRGSSVR